jgi:hypothetical protein
MVNDVIVHFQHGHYQDGMLVMGNTEVTLPEGRMLAASLRFDPVQQVLDAPRARLLSFSGEVLGHTGTITAPFVDPAGWSLAAQAV